MELKLFTDLIDALGKVAGGLKAFVNLPEAEREAMRNTLDETYRLIATTFNMVIIRLGDLLLHAADDDFLREAARLDTYNEWMQAEREFRLCRSLRVALREIVYRMDAFQWLIDQGFWRLKLLLVVRGADYPVQGIADHGCRGPGIDCTNRCLNDIA